MSDTYVKASELSAMLSVLAAADPDRCSPEDLIMTIGHAAKIAEELVEMIDKDSK